jgi:phospholipase/carboxylesterase
MSMLECIEIVTGADPSSSVIWLHGLGADGHDFEPVVEALDLSGLAPIRFVFPHAPFRPVTINGGMTMRAWYDVLSLDFGSRRTDEEGIRTSARQLEDLIRRENGRGVDDGRIVLAGFSQGGAIALHAGLRHPQPLAGIMALSTYLPLASSLAAEASAANRGVPVFMAHGQGDTVIPFQFGSSCARMLQAAGYALEWHDYFMEHGVAPEELRDISAWLRRVLG